MMTNFGRANGMYGDFGRYTFQSALSPWEEQFDIQDLSNIVVKLCLDLGYSPELFSEFDTLDGRYFDRFSNKEERIGKISVDCFYEILANISDNFIPYKLKVTFDDEYNQYIEHKMSCGFLQSQRKIFQDYMKRIWMKRPYSKYRKGIPRKMDS